jgi:Ca-activated chloride channel family protein
VIILLTDGVNAGFIERGRYSKKQYGIKVYTIGIGTNGMAEFPYAVGPNGHFIQMMKVEIDEQLMKSIARKQMVVILELQVTTNWLKYMAK